MFFSEVEKREYAIAPMNCPGHVLTYQSEVRSYRDFPMKLFEFGLVHRNEASGALHGLFRVRSFTQDDAHLMVLPNQLSEEIEKVMEFVDTLLTKFGFSYQINLSTRPELGKSRKFYYCCFK
jgi:threonyl-tRNA synthetase